MGDALTIELEWLTRGVRAVRIARQIRTLEMARMIEIKGLGNIVAEAKKGIGELRGAAAGLNTETSGLKAEIDDLTAQVKQHRADLRFEAETLGNSSVEPVQEPKTPPPPLPPPPPPDVVHTFDITLQQPEPQSTPQDPARSMVR
jgi:hypothetical protein